MYSREYQPAVLRIQCQFLKKPPKEFYEAHYCDLMMKLFGMQFVSTM
jgi:hypothetical protein